MSTTRKEGYYWVKHDGEWVIALYTKYKKWNSVAAGVFIGLDDYHLEEIDEQRIQREQ